MAIKDDNNEQGNTGAPAMSAAFETAQQRSQGKQGQEGGFSFRNMGGLARSAMGRTPASEVLQKLNKALAEVFTDAASKDFEVTLMPVDMNSTTTLGVSILIVALRDRLAPQLGVAYHTLIVEASIESPAPRFEVINGQNTEIIRTVGESYDGVMMQLVNETVSRAFPQSKLLPIGACVVPRDFNLVDTGSIYTLASNALFAASSELETSNPEFVDLNLANADRDSSLTVRTTFGNPQVHNAVGQPVRSDIMVDFSAAPTGQTQNQQTMERTSQVARISGFMDLVWDPVMASQNAYFNPAANANFQRYMARFVGTSLESTSLLTIPAQLLALLPALSLRENNQWTQAFRRTSFATGVDMHDIGAIGIEVNFENNQNGVGTRIDTRADSFKPDQLHKLIAATIKPGLILSLDVPECGPETWYNDVFAAAAEGNTNANAAIINAANVLTNGAFSRHFPSNGRVAVDEFNRIHMGHYMGADGVRKDIRDIDYLAVMNLVGEKDPQVIKDWSDTFLKTNYPLQMRLAARKRIISAIFNDVVYTGFARRVTFDPTFVDALALGSKEAGLVIRSVTSYQDMGSYERATAGFAASSLMSGDSVGIFNHGFGQSNQMFGANRNFNDRWNQR